MCKYIVCKIEATKCNNIIKYCKKWLTLKKKNFNPKKKKKEFNPNRPQASDHSHKMLIVGGSGSGKQIHSDIDKIYLYAKDRYEEKYQLLINKQESAGLKHLNDFKAFIEYSNGIGNINNNQ